MDKSGTTAEAKFLFICNNWGFNFHYERPAGNLSTSCTIVDLRDGSFETHSAYCHPKDQPTKKTGRKIALGRAIADLTREERAEVWAEYFKVVKK